MGAAEGGTAGDVLSFTAEQDGNTWTATVGNPAGVVLPSTGGTGTASYTAAGLAMILLAGILLYQRRRYGKR